MTMDEKTVLGLLDQAGIEKTLITGFDEFSSVHETFIPNEVVGGLAERHPDRFIPFAGADVPTGMDAVRSFEELVRERGFRGLSVRPFMIGLPADDRRYYPLYAKCVELDVPVSIHSSANWTTVAVSDLGHPRHIDAVAADFPELKIIMSHAGYRGCWRRAWYGSTRTSISSWPRTGPATWRRRAPAGSRCCATGPPRSATRSCSGRGGSCSGGRPAGGRRVPRAARPATCSSGGCGATPRRCWARPSRLEQGRLRVLPGAGFGGGQRSGRGRGGACAAVAGRSTTSAIRAFSAEVTYERLR